MIHTIQIYLRSLLIVVAALLLMCIPACQRSSLVENVNVESVLISGFKISDKKTPILEKTIFSIDHRKGLIYNARPLPKGTVIGTVKLQITTGSNVYPRIFVGGVEQTSKGLDTVNLSKYAEGVRLLMQHRKNTNLTKEYQLKINIYEQDPYTYKWTESSQAAPIPANSTDIILSRLVDNCVAYYYFTRGSSETHLWRASHAKPDIWSEITIPSTLDAPIVDIVEQGGGDILLGLQSSGQHILYTHDNENKWEQSNSSISFISHLLGNLYYRGSNRPLFAVTKSDGVHFASETGVLVPKLFPLENNTRLSISVENHPIALLIGGSVADTTALVYSTSNGLDWLTPHDAKKISKIWPSSLPGSMVYEPKDKSILLVKPAATPKQTEQPEMRVYVSLDYGTSWEQLTERSILPTIYYDKAQTHQPGIALYRGDDGRMYIFGGLKNGHPTIWVGKPLRFQ